MKPARMGDMDRFFGDMDLLECRCGLAAPRSSLQDPERRRSVLQRFRKNPGRQLPARSNPTGDEHRRRSSDDRPTRPPSKVLHCPRCGEPLNVSRLAGEDRFFDDYLKCRCGAVCWNHHTGLAGPAGPTEVKDIHLDPKEAAGSRPPPPPSPPPPANPTLWLEDYWVRVDSLLPASLGLPRPRGETTVKCGSRTYQGDFSFYPGGFHAALPANYFGKNVDLRSEVGWLYEDLLKQKFVPEMLDHLLAPMELLCRISPSDQSIFEMLLQNRALPETLLYLQEYYRRVLFTPIIPRGEQRLSLQQLGTTPGYIDPSSLGVKRRHLDILKEIIGPYRFAKR